MLHVVKKLFSIEIVILKNAGNTNSCNKNPSPLCLLFDWCLSCDNNIVICIKNDFIFINIILTTCTCMAYI